MGHGVSSCFALPAPIQHPLDYPARVPKLTLRMVHLRLAITNRPTRGLRMVHLRLAVRMVHLQLAVRHLARVLSLRMVRLRLAVADRPSLALRLRLGLGLFLGQALRIGARGRTPTAPDARIIARVLCVGMRAGREVSEVG